MKHIQFSCDFEGCTMRVSGAHNGNPPPDWGYIGFVGQDADRNEIGVEGNLCPEHVLAVGRQLSGPWTVRGVLSEKPGCVR